MIVLGYQQIVDAVVFAEVIDVMRDALVAESRGDCQTPMPMHMDVPSQDAEIHIKASYRGGGEHFGMKVASGFPRNRERGLSVGPGLMMLFSAETGQPAALLSDDGYLTDVRTAAVGALVVRELGREDKTAGMIGTGIQGRLQMRMLAEILPLETIFAFGPSPERRADYVREMKELLPGIRVEACDSAVAVARSAQLIVSATPAREPLFQLDDLRPGSHVNAVGSDGVGKGEHDPEILRAASLLLVDSVAQCEQLGELQHAPELKSKAVEIGAFCQERVAYDAGGITFCDMTGLGSEDLAIARYCYGKLC